MTTTESASLRGRTCLVTGANSGLGKATAVGLARVGAMVVMLCRNQERGEGAQAEIIAESGSQTVELLLADLSSQASIRAAVADFKLGHDRLHVLINNAAVFLRERQLTEEGLEMVFATNHLGPFLLTNLLLDLLEESAPSRVINVSAPSTSKIDFDDLQGEKNYSPVGAFGASKAANLMFTYALARRIQENDVTVNAYHPGIVRTNLMRQAPAPMRLFGGLLNLFGSTPERAADGLLELASSDQFDGVTGQLIHKGKAISAPYIEDIAAQDRLWRVSMELTGLDTAER
jgi:NAD(P)-dependent dehydrogenase (short-subunit alcohol dehydrogenase family)